MAHNPMEPRLRRMSLEDLPMSNVDPRPLDIEEIKKKAYPDVSNI